MGRRNKRCLMALTSEILAAETEKDLLRRKAEWAAWEKQKQEAKAVEEARTNA
jgi:hypothetical protein